MSLFTDAEIAYMTTERLLGRIATVGRDGTPHIAPVGWSLNREHEVIEIGGHNLAATKKYKDIARSERAAIVIDDVLPPWRPRGIEIRGRAEAVERPEPLIRIHPERIVAWGLDDTGSGSRNARDAVSEPGCCPTPKPATP
ncbi:MAG: PPOX class F420-dependent oxidoreductase [Actinomycetota bacterium]